MADTLGASLMSAPHGTAARGKTCRCEPCRTAKNRAMKAARFDRARGQQRTVDAEPARRHAVRLMERYSASVGDVAAAAAVEDSQVRALLYGKNGFPPAPRIHRATSMRILAVTHIEPYYVSGVGMRRRIEALQWLGHGMPTLAARLGISDEALGQRTQHDIVRATSHQQVDELYRELRNVRGKSGRTLWLARRLNHAPPAAWDDEVIDDPTAKPAEWACCVEGCGNKVSAHSLCVGHARQLEPHQRTGGAYRVAVLRMKPMRPRTEDRVSELWDLGVRDSHSIAERAGLDRDTVVKNARHLNLRLEDAA